MLFQGLRVINKINNFPIPMALCSNRARPKHTYPLSKQKWKKKKNIISSYDHDE